MKETDNWRTPGNIYKILDQEFKFTFDPCPYPKPDWDGLEIHWDKCNFVNPPYSETEKWVRKAFIEWHCRRCISVLLLRLDASTCWFRDLVLPDTEIRLFDDRLHFINTDGKQSRSDHASILVIINGSRKRINLPIIYWRKVNRL